MEEEVEVGSRHKKKKGDGDIGVVCRDYRWTSRQTWTSLKQDLAATVSWGSLYHLGIVRGKNYICLYCVLHEGDVAVYDVLYVVQSVGFGRCTESIATRQW